MPNPSMNLDTHAWLTRPSIQDRVTIYSTRPRRVVCTVLHGDRVAEKDLQLMTAAPSMLRALQLADRAILALIRHQQGAETEQLIYDALSAVNLALVQAGEIPLPQPPQAAPDEQEPGLLPFPS